MSKSYTKYERDLNRKLKMENVDNLLNSYLQKHKKIHIKLKKIKKQSQELMDEIQKLLESVENLI